jgi:hypothetical protein
METLALITLSLVILNIAFNMIFFHFLSQNQIRILKKIQEMKSKTTYEIFDELN